MSFSNPKPLGYAYGELLPSGHVNSVWSQLPNALDGIGGGTYALVNPLTISGDTVSIDTLSVPTELLVDGAAEFAGTSLFTNDATFGDTVSFNHNVTIGNASVDTLTINSTSTLAAVLGFSGVGRILAQAAVVSTALQTVNITQNRIINIGIGVTSTTTISGPSAQDGDWFAVQNFSAGLAQNIAGLVTITGLPNGEGRLYCRLSGVWTLIFAWS